MRAVSFTFDEGRYFDLWMLVHLGAGVASGFANLLFGLTRPQMLALAFGLMLLWEAGELAMHVVESPSNRVIDIAVGMSGVVLALSVAPMMAYAAQLAALVITTSVSLVGMGFGIRAYRRRKAAAERTSPS